MTLRETFTVRRGLALILTAAAAVVALVLIALGGADRADGAKRATNPYTAQEICGSSYHRIDRHGLRDDGIRLGRVMLMYNGSTNCVVTIKTYQPGTVDAMGASVQKRGGKIRNDGGVYKYHAGPRKVYAPGRCIRWTGYITPSETLGDGYVSPFEHCD